MSLFSILNTGSNIGSAVQRASRAGSLSQLGGAVSQFIPDDIRNTASRVLGDVGIARNAIGLGPSVPRNPKPQFDINKFTSELSKSGYLQNNRFHVEIQPPEAIQTDGIDRSLHYRCFASSLPGKTLMTMDIRRHGYGQIERVPHNTMYNEVQLSFILDGEGDISTIFERWLSYIHKAEGWGHGELEPGELASDAVTTDYLLNYKQNYSGPLTINQMNSINQHAYGVKLRQAFPIAIGEQTLAWDQNNSIAVLPVTFAYTDFRQW